MASATSIPITHIVLFKYRDFISWKQLQSHFDRFQTLPSRCLHPDTGKPYVRMLSMGQNISYEPFSKGMTHGIVLEFSSQDDLDYYLLRDEVHAEFSRQAKELIEDSVVLDVRNGMLFAPKMRKPTGLRGLWKGSCHCQGCIWEVRLEDGEEPKHVLCHCDTCKKLSGGPYSCNYIVPDGALKVTAGTPSVYTYKGATGRNVRCYFCPTCTSHICHHQDAMPGKVIIRTLLLDGGNDLTAGGEIFSEGKLGWAQDLRQSLKEATPASGAKE